MFKFLIWILTQLRSQLFHLQRTFNNRYLKLRIFCPWKFFELEQFILAWSIRLQVKQMCAFLHARALQPRLVLKLLHISLPLYISSLPRISVFALWRPPDCVSCYLCDWQAHSHCTSWRRWWSRIIHNCWTERRHVQRTSTTNAGICSIICEN